MAHQFAASGTETALQTEGDLWPPASVTGSVSVPRAAGELHRAPRVALAVLWSPGRQAGLKIGTQLGLLSSWPPPSEEVLTCWAQDLRPSSGLPPPFWIFSGSWRHPQPTMLPEALLGRGCGYLMGQRLYLRSCPGSHLALGLECSLHLLGHRAWEPPGGPKWSSFSQLLLGPLPALGRP